MKNNEEFILGNASLHMQLSAALEVLTQLICNASRLPSAQQLSETLEVSPRYLRKLLRNMTDGGLLQAHPERADTWVFPHKPHEVTLADVCQALAAGKEEQTPGQTDTRAPFTSSGLLLMQAAMSINQAAWQQLQRFDLGRLKMAESALLFTESLREKARDVRFPQSVALPFD